MNEVGERRLAESYAMRRLAQLTIYQWTRLNEWATRQGNDLCNLLKANVQYLWIVHRVTVDSTCKDSVAPPIHYTHFCSYTHTCTGSSYSRSSPVAIRLARRFVRNLQEELKKLQGPGSH